jgi:hypothetical protein
MELCSIDEAFPDLENKKNSSSGESPSKEERRAARKRAKKCKTPAENYLKMVDDIAPAPPVETDPDRPAVKRMGEIPPYVPYEEAFLDLSGGKFEGFKMPILPAANCLISDPGYPSYFGKGLEDASDETPPLNWSSDTSVNKQQSKIIGNNDDLKRLLGSSGIGSGKPELMGVVGSTIGTAGHALYNSVETHQPKGEVDWVTASSQASGDEGFTNMFNDSADAVLNERFEYEFGGEGVAKAGSVSKTLPAPSLDDAWKPLTVAKTTTAFFAPPPVKAETFPSEDTVVREKKIPQSMPPPHTAPVLDESGSDVMRKHMQDLVKRLEDLEAQRKRDTKNEILLFVGTGLFVLVSLDIVARIARK